jgi:hypothetical protein
MNAAFEDGLGEYETTWRMKKLRCIQEAKILSSFIPCKSDKVKNCR